MHIPHAHYLYTVLYALFIELHKFSKPKKKKIKKEKKNLSGGKLSIEREPSGLHPIIDLQATMLKDLEPAFT